MQGFKMHLKLRDQQLKTITCIYISIYRLLYKNLTVNTNQTSIIYMHTKNKKESKITLKIVIKSQEKRKKRKKKRLTKTNLKQLTKRQ